MSDRRTALAVNFADLRPASELHPCLRMRLVLLLTFSLLAACEQSYIIEGKLTVAPAVAPATAASLVVIVDGRANALAAWTILDAADGADQPQAYAPAATYRYEEFGASPHALYLAAFVDVDGNGKLDPGEAFGEYANNPIIDAPWGTVADPSIADIALDRSAP